MDIIVKNDVNTNQNPFFNDLYKLMNNKTFQDFYKKYLNNWDNINTTILYFKLFYGISNLYKKKLGKKISNKDMNSILKFIFSNSLLRKTVLQFYNDYKIHHLDELNLNMIKF